MTAAIDEARPVAGRTFRVDAYVDREFERVRSYVSASPECLLGDGVTSVHVGWAGLDLSRPIRVTGGDLEMGSRFARIPLRWADARHPERFPLIDATLELNPAMYGQQPTTQLVLSGSYLPPFGRFGAAADVLFGHHLVLQSVDQFLARLAGCLERDIPPEPARWRKEP
jgi:hypothetical protein